MNLEEGSYIEDSERRILEGYGKGAFLLGSIRDSKAGTKGKLGQCVYWTRLLSFNRIQSRVFTGLHTGHNTLRRRFYIMGLIDILLCRRDGAGQENSVHVLCACESLATLRQNYLGYFS